MSTNGNGLHEEVFRKKKEKWKVCKEDSKETNERLILEKEEPSVEPGQEHQSLSRLTLSRVAVVPHVSYLRAFKCGRGVASVATGISSRIKTYITLFHRYGSKSCTLKKKT